MLAASRPLVAALGLVMVTRTRTTSKIWKMLMLMLMLHRALGRGAQEPDHRTGSCCFSLPLQAPARFGSTTMRCTAPFCSRLRSTAQLQRHGPLLLLHRPLAWPRRHSRRWPRLGMMQRPTCRHCGIRSRETCTGHSGPSTRRCGEGGSAGAVAWRQLAGRSLSVPVLTHLPGPPLLWRWDCCGTSRTRVRMEPGHDE